MTKRQKKTGYWNVDIESKDDPYGQSIGFTIIVKANSARSARKKAIIAWTNHPYNYNHWYDDFKPYRIRICNEITI